MFMAVVGLIDDENTDLCIRGNGKTCSLTYYLYRYYLQGYEVVSANRVSTYLHLPT